MKDIHTEIEINAPNKRVWQILIDFAQYPQWNPFIVQIVGEPLRGCRLEARIQSPGSRAMTIRPVVLRVEEDEHGLLWRGSLPIPGLFSGEHHFVAQYLDAGRTRFIQGERFTGLLVPLVSRSLWDKIRNGFEEMNRALKARAEEGR
jgi:hypothetical protein